MDDSAYTIKAHELLEPYAMHDIEVYTVIDGSTYIVCGVATRRDDDRIILHCVSHAGASRPPIVVDPEYVLYWRNDLG